MDKVIAILGIVLFLFLLINKITKSGHRSGGTYNHYRSSNYAGRSNYQVITTSDDFDYWKARIKPNCSEMDFISFRDFLSSYGGGYVKREGDGVKREFLGQEKGVLKGIFFNCIVPNPHIDVSRKEEFRQYLQKIGVDGLYDRPDYEVRDTKLKNNKKDSEERKRKDVGNKGEQAVRDVLLELGEDYDVINGPVIKVINNKKEFDHIVIGNNGVFVIETKAFGMTDGKPCKSSLFIDEGDKWIVRKYKKNHEVISPTSQIMEEYNLINSLLSSYTTAIFPVVALSNRDIFLKNNIKLPYEIIRVDELVKYIKSKKECIKADTRQYILASINNCRNN